MTEFEQYYPFGQQIILTSLSVKEGLKNLFSTQGSDVTNEHFALLLPLWEQDGQSQIALCEKTCKSKSNVTRILDNMEKKGLVTRQADGSDRRKLLIYLTDMGKELREPLTALAIDYGRSITKGLSDAEMKTVLQILAKVNQNISE